MVTTAEERGIVKLRSRAEEAVDTESQEGGKESGEDEMSNIKVLTHGVFRLEGEKIQKDDREGE